MARAGNPGYILIPKSPLYQYVTDRREMIAYWSSM